MASKSKRTAEGASGKQLPSKRKQAEIEEDSSSFSEESESEQSDLSEEDDRDVGNEEINVDFEGQDIVKEDFHGIKLLLQRLLLTISVNISELVDIIISQNDIGSTLKVVDDDEGTVYGITTIVDFDKNKSKESIKTLCESLREKCKQSSPSHLPKLNSCLESSICFLLNERFINIPGDVAAPMFCALRIEIEEAKKKGELSNFDYILLMMKGVKPSDAEGSSSHDNTGASSSKKRKKAKRRKDALIQFTNQEDELFFKNATLAFSYCVTKTTGFAISGEWDFDDVSMDTYRTVVVVQSSKLDSIIDEIQKLQS